MPITEMMHAVPLNHGERTTPLTNPLILEIKRAKKEQLGKNDIPWYHLSGTGFFVRDQVDVFLTGIQKRIAQGEGYQHALSMELTKVKVDIEAFEDEYLKQLAALRWNIGWKTIDGKTRLVAKDYNQTPLQEITGKTEREGAVHQLWFEGTPTKKIPPVETWLYHASAQSLAVIVSPSGWSGLHTPNGDPIRYPETQIYVIEKKKGGNLAAHTIRADTDIFQNEALQKKLGINVTFAPDQRARIKNMLTNVALFSGDNPQHSVKSVEDVVNLLQEVKGDPIAFEGKTFDDIRAFLKNPTAYLHRHPHTALLIDQFAEFAKMELKSGHTREETTTNLSIALALTILKLHTAYRVQERRQIKGHSKQLYGYGGIPITNYQDVVADLRTRPGCAGGGKERVQVTSMGSSRIGETDYSFDHKGICKLCKEGPRYLGPCDICESCDPQSERSKAS